MHDPLNLSSYYYICHLFNFLEDLSFTLLRNTYDPVLYFLMLKESKTISSLVQEELITKFPASSPGLWQLTSFLTTELCSPTSISLNRSHAFSPPRCDIRIIFPLSGIIVVKSFRYSQKKQPFTVVFFLLIPGMRLRVTLLHFTVNTINREMSSWCREMIDLNLNELIFNISIQTQVKQQNYPVTVAKLQSFCSDCLNKSLHFQCTRYEKKRVKAPLPHPVVHEILKVYASPPPLLIYSFLTSFPRQFTHCFHPSRTHVLF